MVLTALVFIAVLSLLVFVHELGHFLVARFVGVAVEEFGLGLPPRLFGKKIGKTIYSLNWLPIGGFVKLAGEDTDLKYGSGFTQNNVKHLFWARSKKERAAILVAGVVMNFLLAVVITTGLLVHGVPEPSGRVHVERVLPGTPAKEAGLTERDFIESVAVERIALELLPPTTVKSPRDLISFVKANAGKRVILTIVRDGQHQMISLVPRTDYPKGEGPMGVAISDLEVKKYPLPQAGIQAIIINITRAGEMLSAIGTLVWRLVSLHPVPPDVSGPIGIAHVTGEAVKFGAQAVLEFMSILSLNLAVLNILPIPALDGGRLAFVFLEKFLGKRLKPAFERSTHQIGMIILIGLIVLVSINDIIRLGRG